MPQYSCEALSVDRIGSFLRDHFQITCLFLLSFSLYSDGIDMEHTGLIREINHEAILEKLDHNEIVMISPIGYSPIGEIFNLSYESSASMIAAGLKAEKLIFYTENNVLL